LVHDTNTGGSGGLGDFGTASVPSGATTAFFTGNANSQPVEIHSIGRNIWMSLQGSSSMLIVDTSGAVVASTVVTAGAGPQGITLGSDGNVWVTGLLTEH
jgi:streptogramin lyase